MQLFKSKYIQIIYVYVSFVENGWTFFSANYLKKKIEKQNQWYSIKSGRCWIILTQLIYLNSYKWTRFRHCLLKDLMIEMLSKIIWTADSKRRREELCNWNSFQTKSLPKKIYYTYYHRSKYKPTTASLTVKMIVLGIRCFKLFEFNSCDLPIIKVYLTKRLTFFSYYIFRGIFSDFYIVSFVYINVLHILQDGIDNQCW